MGYGLILLAIPVWLAVRYCQKPMASTRSKVILASAAASVFLIPSLVAGYPGFFLQMGVCCGMVLYTEAMA